MHGSIGVSQEQEPPSELQTPWSNCVTFIAVHGNSGMQEINAETTEVFPMFLEWPPMTMTPIGKNPSLPALPDGYNNTCKETSTNEIDWLQIYFD